MSGNKRHAGGMKSAMDNLKKIDARIAATALPDPPTPIRRPMTEAECESQDERTAHEFAEGRGPKGCA